MKALPLLLCLLPLSASAHQMKPSDDELVRFSLFSNSTLGLSSNEAFDQQVHGHDPREGLNLQALELGLYANITDSLLAYGNGVAFLQGDNWSAEWEEGYLNWIRLPHGIEVKAGRFFNDIGTENSKHIHEWEYVNANLTTSQFFGEDGLITDGAELSWYYVYENYGVVGLALNAGRAVTHGEHESGGHDHAENLGTFAGDVASARLTVHHYVDDTRQHFFGLNAVIGENGYERSSFLLGFDYNYTWSQRGNEKDGLKLDTGFELMFRNVGWQHEDAPTFTGATEQLAAMAHAKLQLTPEWHLGARYEWMEGVSDGGLLVGGEIEHAFDSEQRQRFSLALTRSFSKGTDFSGYARLQYSHDEAGGESADSIWLQFSFSFGVGMGGND